MAQSSIVLPVILPSTRRTDDILAATAERLGIERITPDHHGRAQLRMQSSGPEAFEAVKQALRPAGRTGASTCGLATPSSRPAAPGLASPALRPGVAVRARLEGEGGRQARVRSGHRPKAAGRGSGASARARRGRPARGGGRTSAFLVGNRASAALNAVVRDGRAVRPSWLRTPRASEHQRRAVRPACGSGPERPAQVTQPRRSVRSHVV